MYDPARAGDELAAQLLDVTNEAELEGFLGRLVYSVVQRAGGPVPATTGRALVAALRGTAERTLPTLTTALRDPLGPPNGVGSSAAETAARVYGLELEGMSPEDRDYEIARQFLRFAQAVAVRAARAPAGSVDAAVAGVSRELAPGLLLDRPEIPTGARPPHS
jgi:hypothetical protein